MNSIRYDKLVLDRIPEIIREAGKIPVTDILPQKEVLPVRGRKLQEEVQEYLENLNTEERWRIFWRCSMELPSTGESLGSVSNPNGFK